MYCYISLLSYRVANAVCIWLKTANAELVKDVTFLKLLRELQDSLPKDGLTQQLTELTSSLATSIKSSNTTSSSSSPSPATASIGIQSFLKVSWISTGMQVKGP